MSAAEKTGAPRVLLQPAAGTAAREHYRETIETPVSLGRMAPHLSSEELENLEKLYPSEAAYVWGLTPGKGGRGRTKWEEISPGDIALFSWNNKFRVCARVSAKTRNPDLARELWGANSDGETWEYVYFLTEPHSCDVPYEEFNKVVGYKRGFVPQGFNALDQEKSEAVLVQLDLPVDNSALDSKRSVWWVNQGTTYREHRELGIVWAPQKTRSGSQVTYHSNVSRLRPGDRILHYADGVVRAVGIVDADPVETESSPEDGVDQWSGEGFQASVEYNQLTDPIARDDIPLDWRREEGSPFTSDGAVQQGYLFELSDAFARKMAGRWPEEIGRFFPWFDPEAVTQDLDAVCADFSSKLQGIGLEFGARHKDFVRDFVVSLATKQLVILTGLSGSGKTQIALQFGRWLGEAHYEIIPVRPDWTGAEALFGYEDALQPPKDGRKAWHVPEPLRFMLRAARDPKRPYLLILDEMNLAHVERYFADVISGMESDEGCLPNVRPDDEGTWREVTGEDEPSRLQFPANLFVAGTVNVDETTYMFSPKVLDRANTMEFRVATEDLRADVRKPGRCPPGDPALVRGFLALASDQEWHREHPAADQDRFVELLKRLHANLDHGFSFGHRVLFEAVRFAALHESANGESMEEALDVQVLQKVLPRLHGSRRRLEPVLRTVGKFCWDLQPSDTDGEGVDGFDPAKPPEGEQATLPRSFDKVRRMTERLRTNQFVSFTE